MAIDVSVFRPRWGVAVMIYKYAEADWFFLCWATKNGVVIDLPPGSYALALWLINGDLSGYSTVEYDGTSVIYAMRARR